MLKQIAACVALAMLAGCSSTDRRVAIAPATLPAVAPRDTGWDPARQPSVEIPVPAQAPRSAEVSPARLPAETVAGPTLALPIMMAAAPVQGANLPTVAAAASQKPPAVQRKKPVAKKVVVAGKAKSASPASTSPAAIRPVAAPKTAALAPVGAAAAKPPVPVIDTAPPLPAMLSIPTRVRAEELFARARQFDDAHQTALAVPLYADASRQGVAAASMRLMEIFSDGTKDVPRNYLAAVEFKRLAMQQGMTLEYPPRREKVR